MASFVFLTSCVYTVIIVVGSVLNASIMSTALKQSKIKRSDEEKVNIYFIMNLAIADVLNVFVVVPVYVVEQNLKSWPFGQFFCCFIYSVTNAISFVSVLAIGVLGLHRNLILLRPSWLNYLNSRNARCFLVVIWLVSYTLFGLPLLFVMKVARRDDNTTACDPKPMTKTGARAHITYMMTIVAIPLLTASISYLKMKKVFKRISKTVTNTVYLPKPYTNKFMGKLRKFTRLLNVIICGFFVCFSPYIALCLFVAYSPHELRGVARDVMVSVVQIIFYCNPLVNPFALIVWSRSYNKGFKNLLVFLRIHKREQKIVFVHKGSKITPEN